MRSITKVFIYTGLLFILIPFTPLETIGRRQKAKVSLTRFICFAQNQDYLPQESTAAPEHKSGLFQGEINANNIHIRSDSTVSSTIICIVHKGESAEVVRELYEWYRVRLPKTAPSFIKKNLVAIVDEKTAKVIKDNVNIRLRPGESSPILGKADKNEVINILEERGEWYKIEPLNNSFGWVNKKFVNPAPQEAMAIKPWGGVNKASNTINGVPPGLKPVVPSGTESQPPMILEENATIEGIIKPYGRVIKRIATHKLITADNNVLLLKGDKRNLDCLNYHKVRVTGKLIHPKNPKHTIIEILKIEALD